MTSWCHPPHRRQWGARPRFETPAAPSCGPPKRNGATRAAPASKRTASNSSSRVRSTSGTEARASATWRCRGLASPEVARRRTGVGDAFVAAMLRTARDPVARVALVRWVRRRRAAGCDPALVGRRASPLLALLRPRRPRTRLERVETCRQRACAPATGDPAARVVHRDLHAARLLATGDVDGVDDGPATTPASPTPSRRARSGPGMLALRVPEAFR